MICLNDIEQYVCIFCAADIVKLTLTSVYHQIYAIHTALVRTVSMASYAFAIAIALVIMKHVSNFTLANIIDAED